MNTLTFLGGTEKEAKREPESSVKAFPTRAPSKRTPKLVDGVKPDPVTLIRFPTIPELGLTVMVGVIVGSVS